MCWTRMVGAAVAAGLAGGAPAATLVVRANGPSAALYRPGRVLPDAGTLALKAGDSVTVLDAHGTRVLSGPGTVRVAGTGTAAAGLATLLASSGARQSRTGATRGTSTVARPTNVWLLDAARGGTTCVADPAALALWRPDAAEAGTLALAPAAGGASATVAFRQGQATAPWPAAALPVADGARFTVAAPGAAPVPVRLRLLGAVPSGLDGTAQALLANGCAAQVDLLAAATLQN